MKSTYIVVKMSNIKAETSSKTRAMKIATALEVKNRSNYEVARVLKRV